jgi:hypothetical protein
MRDPICILVKRDELTLEAASSHATRSGVAFEDAV